MHIAIVAQPTDQIQQLDEAVNTAQVSGWDVLMAVVVVALAYPVGRIVARAATAAARRVPGMPDEVVNDIGRLTKWFVYLVAGAWALSLLGVSVGWVAIVVAVVAVFGFLMARPMIENIAAGTLLTVRPAFGVGDQVNIGGYRGTVEEIGSRSTVLRTNNGVQIHVANTNALGHPIIVYTAYDGRKASFDVSVTHDTDLDTATKVLLEAIAGVDNVQDDPGPEAQATGFDSTAITLSIQYWYPSSMTSDGSVTDGVIRAVKTAITESGIELAVPILDVASERSPATPDATSGTDAEAGPASDDPTATSDASQSGS